MGGGCWGWVPAAGSHGLVRDRARQRLLDANRCCNSLRIATSCESNLMRIATCCVSQHRNWLRIATKCERQQVAHRNSLLRIATACCDPRPVQLANLKRHPHRPLWSALLRGGGRLKTRNTFRGVGIIQTCGGTSESAPPPHSSSSARIPVRPQHAGARRHWLVRRGPGGSDQQPPAGAEILTGAAPPGKLRFCTACKRAGLYSERPGRRPAAG